MSASVRCPVCEQQVELRSVLEVQGRRIPRHKVPIPGTNGKKWCEGSRNRY